MKTASIAVTLIDSCGSDLSVVNAARVSFDKESEWEGVPAADGKWAAEERLSTRDAKLISYLAKHQHTSPFNHCFASFRVKAPIFVARQLVKHKFLPWNEVSRRYVDSEPEFYIPNRWRMAAENVKQGSSDVAMQIDSAFRNPFGATKNSRRSPCATKFANWKARAVREGSEFTLTAEDVPWVTHCPILGIELDWSLCHGDGIKKDSPTLDRIDNSKGYVVGNVMVICSLANTMKSYATPEELKTFSRSMLLQYGGEFMGPSSSVEQLYEETADLYKRLIESGLCAEQARMFLPQSTMTEWIWSGTLGAWADMCRLRLDPHAQLETREVAQKISDEMRDLYPESWKALLET